MILDGILLAFGFAIGVVILKTLAVLLFFIIAMFLGD